MTAPVTFKVPATAVFPEDAVTVNLLILTLKSPVVDVVPPTLKLSVKLTLPSGTSKAFCPSVPVITSFFSLASHNILSLEVALWKVTSAPAPSLPTVNAPARVKLLLLTQLEPL